MKHSIARAMRGTATGILCLLFSLAVQAQTGGSMLSGVIRDITGIAIPDAKVSLKNAATGAMATTQSDSSGHYSFSNLPAGTYELDASAPEYNASVTQVSMAGADQTVDVTMAGTLSLNSLGFSSAQTQGSAADQARLDKRSHMLRVHQELGLVTAVPMVAAIITGTQAGGRATRSTARDVHLGLGVTTAGLYFTSASFAIFAPKIQGVEAHGPIRLHKALAWIHGSGMVLTPILGAMAFEQLSRGERVHGIASAHGAVAIVTASAYGAAILSVSVNSKNWKFWKRF